MRTCCSKARPPSACGRTNTTAWAVTWRGARTFSPPRNGKLLEESGLTADLWLCGIAIVDAGDDHAGICLYLFTGDCLEGEPQPSEEGQAEWIPYERLGELPVVEDLPILLAKIQDMQRGDPPFSARSYYDERGRLVVEFGE